jgi:hypothetical protein
VSDSDDLFNFSLMQLPGPRQGGVGSTSPPEESREKAGTLHLARLLETLDHYQISSIYVLLLVLVCVAMSLSVPRTQHTRCVLCNAGRAPPCA